MKYLIIALLILSSCKKDTKTPNTPSCDCYELHEVVTPQGFPAQMIWTFDYSTDTIPDNCDKDNGVWTYHGNANQYRYRTICQ